ncbi:MAG: DUF2791 family P-loop domain-containing protein, partial [Thermaerobacter sp.]|nr:DUF2791 family P-loop domain-containing protein [Thermaerobacter sp.]
QARAIVEGLRSGIPYRETAEAMTVGREPNLRALANLMDAVSQGRSPKTRAQIVRGQYGEGKTHLMHALAAQAWDANWVVSLISLSKETPLDRLDHLYPKLLANIYRPGSNQPGIEPIVAEALSSPHLLAEARDVELTERTRTVVDNLARQNAGFAELTADIGGRFLTTAELKRIHRENFTKPLKMAATRIRDEIPAYFRLVDWLIRRADYGGWLLLFDEVELIGKLGRGGRAHSYANLGRFFEGVGERTLSVFSVAGNFQTDVVVARHDMEGAPQWLSARPREAGEARFAEIALQELAAAHPLDPPTSGQIRQMLERVYALHQEAYQWSPPFAPDDFYDRVRQHVGTFDARLRTWIRIALTLLDVALQYGDDDAEATIHAGVLADIDLSADPDAGQEEGQEAAESDAEDLENPGVSRRRLFDKG